MPCKHSDSIQSLAASLVVVSYLTAANAAMVLLTLFLSGSGPWTSIFWYTLSASSALPDLACRLSRELQAILQPLQSYQGPEKCLLKRSRPALLRVYEFKKTFLKVRYEDRGVMLLTLRCRIEGAWYSSTTATAGACMPQLLPLLPGGQECAQQHTLQKVLSRCARWAANCPASHSTSLSCWLAC